MIIYGINPVLEALQSEDRVPDRIWITRGTSNPRLQGIIERARRQGISVRFESARVVANKASTPHHQEIVAEIARNPHQPEGWRRDGIDFFVAPPP